MGADGSKEPAKSSEDYAAKHLKGKYGWDSTDNKPAENAVLGVISNYAFSDGTKNVSIYVDVADDVPEDAVTLEHTPESLTLRVQDKRLHIPKLAHEITGATLQRKPGRNQAVVKLAKKDPVT